eukprot:jgi/Bigna1/80535/fgenesh1_pg.72_\
MRFTAYPAECSAPIAPFGSSKVQKLMGLTSKNFKPKMEGGAMNETKNKRRWVNGARRYGTLSNLAMPLPKKLQRSLWADRISFTSYSGKRILDNVSAFAVPGDILAIMGPSGAGKTTFMDLMAGREMNRFRGFEGSVKVNGRPRTGGFVEISGHTSSSPVFIATLTVRETIQYAASLSIADSILSWYALALFNCESYFDDYVVAVVNTAQGYEGGDRDPGTSSGISDGERKRLAIALQLLRTPSILLLDEPTSGLDTTSSRQVVSILRGLADRGFTIIINIHSPDSRIYSQFDRLLMLVAGRVQYFGKAAYAVESYMRICQTKIGQFV